ncbi:MAG: UDP-N-acetylmuramoyl-L-alanine--D-glutamate ligase [Corynebacterium sp.]|nr:UDP-N-acetylmuramoyl-L-alanine--D-glutamate ligase [Corynebacterium sp.]
MKGTAMSSCSKRSAAVPARVLIAGGGVSGRGCARILHQLGSVVTLADANPDTRAQVATELGIATVAPAELTFATNADEREFDLVVTSPGWRPDSPLLVDAQQAGYEVIGDVELAYRLDQAEVFGPRRRWLAITGTNGKTTTTGMVAAIMQADSVRTGQRARAVGNIGASLFDALGATERIDVIVAELSSFQLHWAPTLHCEVGALLNLAEDHLDWHGSFAAYAADKARILRADTAVVGIDDDTVRDIAQRVVATADAGQSEPATMVAFSAQSPQTLSGWGSGVGFENGHIVAEEVLASAEGIEPAGLAGILDATAAAAIARAAGATPASIAQGLAGYRVAGHRGAIVHVAGGINFVDNSKATNPHAADAALEGLNNVIWLAGGQLKGADIDPVVKTHHHRLKAAVVLGVDRVEVAESIAKHASDLPMTVIDDCEPARAMEKAVRAAIDYAVAGDTILLAPAAASLDMYTGMAQRGDMFKAAAHKLLPAT